jgi:hypothetical protein
VCNLVQEHNGALGDTALRRRSSPRFFLQLLEHAPQDTFAGKRANFRLGWLHVQSGFIQLGKEIAIRDFAQLLELHHGLSIQDAL